MKDTGRGPGAVEVRVAARPDNLAMLRTLVGAVGAISDLDIDAIADLRLAVDEACTGLIRAAAPGAGLTVVVDPGDEAVVVHAWTESDSAAADGVVAPGSFSWHVLRSLTDDVATFGSDGRVVGITLTTRRAGVSR
jgi:serine/threonine-protein kinase RsbW